MEQNEGAWASCCTFVVPDSLQSTSRPNATSARRPRSPSHRAHQPSRTPSTFRRSKSAPPFTLTTATFESLLAHGFLQGRRHHLHPRPGPRLSQILHRQQLHHPQPPDPHAHPRHRHHRLPRPHGRHLRRRQRVRRIQRLHHLGPPRRKVACQAVLHSQTPATAKPLTPLKHPFHQRILFVTPQCISSSFRNHLFVIPQRLLFVIPQRSGGICFSLEPPLKPGHPSSRMSTPSLHLRSITYPLWGI